MKADLHVHSMYSEDGHSTPEEIIARAKELGFGCIAITDHNDFRSFEDVKDCKDIIFVPGEEVGSADGHIIALGIDREIPKHLPIPETIDLIHEAGGIAIAAHPYRWWTGLGEKNTLMYADRFDGIEALNARSTKKHNTKSLKLATENGKCITAGSDAHKPGPIGGGYVELPDDCRTWQDVIQAIKDRKVVPYSSNRKMIASLRYGLRSIFNWSKRGFHDM
ncbi:MAG: PHP domain-containing protein [Candidatus Methanomethylophilaceae archaeon]|nr:PHP domain-containing protein [Candidatus Methanomethylophilaceae archaeon]